MFPPSFAATCKTICLYSDPHFHTYGPAIKDIIHEQGGNAIMSAIDFGLDVDVTEDAEGNHRVIIKFDGKLLPYAKKGKYPW